MGEKKYTNSGGQGDDVIPILDQSGEKDQKTKYLRSILLLPLDQPLVKDRWE